MRKDLRNRKIRIGMSAFSNRNGLYNPVIPCLLFYQGKTCKTQTICSQTGISIVWRCHVLLPTLWFIILSTNHFTSSLDKASRLSIRLDIRILLSDTICQHIQFYTNSQAAMLSSTRQLNNWRLTGYLEQATRQARLGTRSVLRSAGKFQI